MGMGPSRAEESGCGGRVVTVGCLFQLDALFESSALASHYRHSTVTSLRPSEEEGAEAAELATDHHVDVGCDLVLADAALLPDLVERAGLAFLRGLRRRAGHAWLGDLAVDVQSIGFVGESPSQRDVLLGKQEAASMTNCVTLDALLLVAGAPIAAEPVVPVPSAADPSVPGWAPWSAWSECYWTGTGDNRVGEGAGVDRDSRGTMVRLRSRACAMDGGRGRPLDGPEPCLLRLPSAGSHFEMEACAQSQPAPGAPTAATILIQGTAQLFSPQVAPSSNRPALRDEDSQGQRQGQLQRMVTANDSSSPTDTGVALSPAKPSPAAASTPLSTTPSSTTTTIRIPSPSTSSVTATQSTVITSTPAVSTPATATKVSLSSSLSSTEPNPSPFSMTTLLVPVIVTEKPTTTSTTTEASRRKYPPSSSV